MSSNNQYILYKDFIEINPEEERSTGVYVTYISGLTNLVQRYKACKDNEEEVRERMPEGLLFAEVHRKEELQTLIDGIDKLQAYYSSDEIPSRSGTKWAVLQTLEILKSIRKDFIDIMLTAPDFQYIYIYKRTLAFLWRLQERMYYMQTKKNQSDNANK